MFPISKRVQNPLTKASWFLLQQKNSANIFLNEALLPKLTRRGPFASLIIWLVQGVAVAYFHACDKYS